MIYKKLPRLILPATLILMHVSGEQWNYRQKSNYRQNSNYGQNSNYEQKSNYGQNSNYEQKSNYGQNSNYEQKSSYGQPSNYEQNSNHEQNSYCEQNYRPTSNNSYYDRKHQRRYVDYSFTQGDYCCPTNRISKLYTDYLIPDATKLPPHFICDITFPKNNYVCLGNEMTHDQTQIQPDMNYPTRPGDYHSVFLIDFDASSWPPFVHWWASNIPGGDIKSAENIFDFVGPNPPRQTGWHRYVFMVFKQPGKVDYSDMPEIASTDRPPRFNFSLYYQVNKYNFDPTPHCMNYFMLRYNNVTFP